MSTAAPAAPKKLTFLQHFGADIKKVFNWVGSPSGQKVIVTAEGVGETIANIADPALAGLDPLITSWTQEIFKSEALATGALAQEGTDTMKAGAVLTAVTPQLTSFITTNKLVGTDVNAANSALVAFFNALGAPAA
jgi:hypothetical protein